MAFNRNGGLAVGENHQQVFVLNKVEALEGVSFLFKELVQYFFDLVVVLIVLEEQIEEILALVVFVPLPEVGALLGAAHEFLVLVLALLEELGFLGKVLLGVGRVEDLLEVEPEFLGKHPLVHKFLKMSLLLEIIRSISVGSRCAGGTLRSTCWRAGC